VPFLSKVTGVPMVELAVRIALGAALEELGWPGGLLPPPPFVAVKAPAFSTTKLRGVDPSVGPSMQSTGEVIGIHEDADVALAKALRGANLLPPTVPPAASFADATEPPAPPVALLSIADRDKGSLVRLARALELAGYRLAGTPGTRAALGAAGIAAEPVAKLGAEPDPSLGEVGLLDLLLGGRTRLVVNTPTPRSGPVRDAAEIRHTAISEGIPCLTAIETAVAAAEALDPAVAGRLADVRSIVDWLSIAPVAARAAAASDAPVLSGERGTQ
jgi:carbamoyl-phosphate synthase large subunit